MALERYTAVVCKLNTKAGEVILFCEKCNVPLAITRNMCLYCPRCVRDERDEKVDVIMCCTRCKFPVFVSLEHESYCETCNSHPTADDRFFRMIKDL